MIVELELGPFKKERTANKWDSPKKSEFWISLEMDDQGKAGRSSGDLTGQDGDWENKRADVELKRRGGRAGTLQKRPSGLRWCIRSHSLGEWPLQFDREGKCPLLSAFRRDAAMQVLARAFGHNQPIDRATR